MIALIFNDTIINEKTFDFVAELSWRFYETETEVVTSCSSVQCYPMTF